MTKEEAIKELSVQYLGDSDQMRESKDMAISALKGEWVPVKGLDDVPKNGTIWITLKRPYVSICVDKFTWVESLKAWVWDDDYTVVSEVTSEGVTAYMPYVVPEPYKKGE